MTDETNPTSGQPTNPAQPEQTPAPQPPQPPPAPQQPPAAAVPPPGGYGQAPAPGPYDMPAPAKKSGAGMRIVRIVAGVVVVVLIGVGWKAWQNHHETASAPEKGACVHAKGTDTKNPSVQKVDCADTTADYVVLAKISGGSSTSCDTVTGTEAAFSSTRGDKTLYVLCLKHK